MAVWYAFADLFLSRLDAETAHGLALRALKSGLAPAEALRLIEEFVVSGVLRLDRTPEGRI